MSTLYSRITEYCNSYCHNCREYKAVCPDCGAPICVTCMDACDECLEDLW